MTSRDVASPPPTLPPYLGVDMGHDKLRLNDHEQDAGHAEDESVVGELLTLREQFVAFTVS